MKQRNKKKETEKNQTKERKERKKIIVRKIIYVYPTKIVNTYNVMYSIYNVGVKKIYIT